VPEILASAHLQIGADVVRLAISKVARVPDSEVVGDRLGLVASAVGVRRTEIVEAASEPDREGPAAPPWPIPR
jgi:exopolyphosphatase / guanosine-5'-triphosphate,3'-diphosphate pyrophosphatase